MLNNWRISFILVLILVSHISCIRAKKQNSSKKQLNPMLAEFHNQVKDVFNKPEKPSKISFLLKHSGALFLPELMNNPAYWEKYTDNDTRAAANLGVYMADALIQYSYDSIKGAYNSANAGLALANSIGISNDAFKAIIRDRYNEKEELSDSLFFRLDSALAKAESELTSEARFKLLSAIYVGNFIEKQYYITTLIFTPQDNLPYEENVALIRRMMLIYTNFNHRLEYIIELTEIGENIDNLGFMSGELKSLKVSFDRYNYSDDELYYLTPEIVLNNKKLIKEYEMIKNMRNFIVNPKQME